MHRPAPPWEQRFHCFLRRAAGLEDGPALAGLYGAAFPPGYRELTPPALAGRDVLRLRQAAESGEDAFELWQATASHGHLLRLYSRRARFLDELMPFLAGLGLRVADHVQFALDVPGRMLWVTSFSVRPAQPEALPLSAVKKNLLEALGDLLAGRAESDGLNGLLPLTGLGWREIDVFRGYRNYYLQLGRRFTQASVHLALLRNASTALLLYRYFDARFNPDLAAAAPPDQEEDALSALRTEIAAALDRVADSQEDRILRDLFNLIDATLRTSHYLRRRRGDYFFAFKIDSLGVLDMPTPSPLFEIYVHAAHMEGIHLRGAKVARGGIRWSDRPDDFRGEILGLMRTQTIKNALIVPHGAKGGFIIKTPCRDRETCQRLAGEAYATLIRGLLDLTDNIAEAGVAGPPGVVAYDGGDPYLVVAADKGTAHLSDTANAISQEYGFWLGDAFASGGSRGYDHKKLGITARGAWACVQRHFRELGRDLGQPFSVVGIGSMDGDVFGNGMLLSASIRLKAAFGAKYIFLDPNPDAEASFRERKRLFELPGSSWDDYDRRLVSPGGGVFPRAAKDIALSAPVRQWLGAQHGSTDGEGLIRLLLAAPVDLLWLGGIGTYVKASTETHEQVGDRGNDAVRIDACQLRASVAGEGANLGFTQKARVEFALAGGRINNDAVDNSAGVDLSDHEVNLKILMAEWLRKGLLAGLLARDAWLQAMTAEVCGQVLADNRLQSLCLSLDLRRCRRDAEPFLDVADSLENLGLLERAAESFPGRKEVLARPDKSLARPELAVLMLHAKLALKQVLLESPDFLSLPALAPWLDGYFPQALRERCAGQFGGHPLAREITATALANTVVNQAGGGFLSLAESADAAALVEAVQAYLSFDEMINGPALRSAVAGLESELPAERQYQYLLGLEDVLADYCRWALAQGGPPLQDAQALPRWRAYFEEYLDVLAASLWPGGRAAFEAEAGGLEREGFERRTARLIALLDRLSEFPALAELAVRTQVALPEAARAYRAVAECLGLARIESLLGRVAARDRWERRIQILLRGRFRFNLARLARALIESGCNEPAAFFEQSGGGRRLERLRSLHRELDHAAAAAILPYAALSAELDGLAEFCFR